MDQEVLTSEEAASYLRLSTTTVKRLARERRVPGAKVGRQWRFRRGDLDDWLACGGDLSEAVVNQSLVEEAERRLAANEEKIPWEQVKGEVESPLRSTPSLVNSPAMLSTSENGRRSSTAMSKVSQPG